MNYIRYEDINKNRNIDIEKVNKLIFNNDRNIDNYYILSIPKLEQKEINKSIYVQEEKGINYEKELNLIIPSLYLYKIILIIEEKEIKVIYDNNNPFINNNKLEVFNIIDNEIQKLFRLTYDIKRLITHIDFYIAYKLVECIDKLILYTSFYISFMNDMKNLIKDLKVPMNITDVINHLVETLNNTRHAIMQRIAYLDSGTARILTIVATIFLPASFLISIVTMDLYDNPLKKLKKPFITFFVLILILFISLFILFRKDFIMLFN
jgi:Mg2+ and Co2+ transporter CorA